MPPKAKTEESNVSATGQVDGDNGSAQTGSVSHDGTGPTLSEIDPNSQTISRKGAGLLDPDAPSDVLTTATIIVRGPAKGRWRIGRHFGTEPVTIPEADLTREQKHALANDPELLIQLIDPTY